MVIYPYQIELSEIRFTPQIVRDFVNEWDRLTVRYSCTVKCTIITARVPVAVALWDHVDAHGLLDGGIIPGLNIYSNSALKAESLLGALLSEDR